MIPADFTVSKAALKLELGWYKITTLYFFNSLISLGLTKVTLRCTLDSIARFKAPISGWLIAETKAILVFWSITSTANFLILLNWFFSFLEDDIVAWYNCNPILFAGNTKLTTAVFFSGEKERTCWEIIAFPCWILKLAVAFLFPE